MRVQHIKNEKRYVLDPGDHYITDKPIIISTLLGSCVSACLYDPINKVMGMNHFLLSNKRYMKDGALCLTEAGRYGVHAMEIIINGMINQGAARKYIKAKAFGGGNVLQPTAKKTGFFCVGEVNTRFIKEFLENEKIQLVTSDLGGNHGRVIRFYGSDYSVYVKKIGIRETDKIRKRDNKYWKQTIQKQKEKETEIELW